MRVAPGFLDEADCLPDPKPCPSLAQPPVPAALEGFLNARPALVGELQVTLRSSPGEPAPSALTALPGQNR
jgi:hypothetical protein